MHTAGYIYKYINRYISLYRRVASNVADVSSSGFSEATTGNRVTALWDLGPPLDFPIISFILDAFPFIWGDSHP